MKIIVKRSDFLFLKSYLKSDFLFLKSYFSLIKTHLEYKLISSYRTVEDI